MNKILILDPLQHCPGIKTLYSNADYWCMFKPAVPMEPCYRKRCSFEKYYNFKVKKLFELDKQYERVCIVLPLYAVVGSDRPQYFKELLYKLYEIIYSKNPKKIIFFDTHDNSYVPLEYLDEKKYKFDVIFKTNYRKIAKETYDSRVVSFPFIVFGPIDCFNIVLTSKPETKSNFRDKKCFWGSGASGKFIFGSRPDIEKRVQKSIEFNRDKYLLNNKIINRIIRTQNLSHIDFMNYMKTSRAFMILNGTGKVHRRLFEGISSECLAIIERNDVIYPEEVLKLWDWNNRCSFDTPEEFIEILDKILYNDKFYYKKLESQENFRKKILNKKWMRRYINENLHV